MRETDSFERQQAAVFDAFASNNKMILPSAQLLAYAAKAVTDPVEELQRILNRAFESEALHTLSVIYDARSAKEAAIDEKNFEKAAAIRGREVELLTALGQTSGLNVHVIKRLCDQIIAEARRDLRGEQDEPLGRTPNKRRFPPRWR
ncbi:hypothetical protein [Mycolicibacterium peregrinum]|uniref:hypothetical protein n=1 Tax=Mycolicibacterium peregrinum TaxID=43304 RepID=UPI003AAD847B